MTGEPSSSTASSIRVEYRFDDPPSLVWRTLTEPDLLARWLMPNDIRAEVGATFTFRGEPTPWWEGIVYCEVLEVVRHERLVYRWRGAPQCQQKIETDLDTIVSWTLIPNPEGGTTLLLEHSGFDSESFVFQAMSNGWSGKAGLLRELMSQLN